MITINKETLPLLDRIHFWKPFNAALPDKEVPIKYVIKDLVKIFVYTHGSIKNEENKDVDIPTSFVICASTLNQYYALQPLIERLSDNCTLISDNPMLNEQQPNPNYYIRLSLRYAMDRVWFYYNLPEYERNVYRRRYYKYHIILGQYRHWFRIFKRNKKLRYYLASNDHSGMSQIGFVAARDAGLKTIYIQHAAVSDLFPPLIVDYALLDGEDAKQKYLKAGPTDTKIYLIGTIKYDSYLRSPLLHEQGELIGVCLGSAAHDIEENMRFCKILETRNKPFCVRFHPNINVETRQIFIKEGWEVSLPEEETALDFIFRCHSIIAADSTILLEAIVLKRRPVYFTSDGICRDYYGFLKQEVLDRSYNTAEEVIEGLDLPFDLEYHRRKAKWFCDSLYTDYEGYSTEKALEILRYLDGIDL